MRRIFFMFLAALTLVACGEDDPKKPSAITVSDQKQLTQTIYADDNAGKSGVTFATDGAWTSEITESTTSKSTRTVADWISITPSSGDKAGNYTINISLETNYTGKKRSANITIKCNGEMIEITITQESTTQTGEKPTIETPKYHHITPEGKIVGSEIYGEYVLTSLSYSIRAFGGFSQDQYYSQEPVAYQNNDFDITLITPPANVMAAAMSGGVLSSSKADAKFAWAGIYEPSEEADFSGDSDASVTLTNVTWKSAIDSEYVIKTGDRVVFFIYASENTTLNGQTHEGMHGTVGNLGYIDLIFTNYSLIQGWNEVAFVATSDASNIGVTMQMQAEQVDSASKCVWVARETTSGSVSN